MGTEAFIWPLLPTDRAALRRSTSTFPPESRFQPLQGAVPAPDRGMLDHLVDAVNGIDHVALVLFAFSADALDALAGIARVVRYPDKPPPRPSPSRSPTTARSGVATALLEALEGHRPTCITEIETQVSTDNPAAMALCGGLETSKLNLPARTASTSWCIFGTIQRAARQRPHLEPETCRPSVWC